MPPRNLLNNAHLLNDETMLTLLKDGHCFLLSLIVASFMLTQCPAVFDWSRAATCVLP